MGKVTSQASGRNSMEFLLELCELSVGVAAEPCQWFIEALDIPMHVSITLDGIVNQLEFSPDERRRDFPHSGKAENFNVDVRLRLMHATCREVAE